MINKEENTKEYIATKHLSNGVGIGIHSIDNMEDKIYFSYCSDKKGKEEKADLEIDNDGRFYFYSKDQIHYIDEFMRVNYIGGWRV